jgi:hypothetical protein
MEPKLDIYQRIAKVLNPSFAFKRRMHMNEMNPMDDFYLPQFVQPWAGATMPNLFEHLLVQV